MKSLIPIAIVRSTITAVLLWTLASSAAAEKGSRVELKRDDAMGQLQIVMDGKEALVYRYGKDVDLPHFFPVRSPSGKSMTAQQIDPFPHHRSVWFADTVQLAGQRKVSTYMALYSGVDRKDPKPPFRDHVRQVEFLPARSAGSQAEIGMKLLWEMDSKVPVLEETRQLRIVALDKGEYFLDMKFTVTAAYGSLTFLSDAAHYAWPYVRMAPEFSVQKGGTMVNSEGGVNQKGTNGKPAHWVDYSNTIAGVAEGLCVFSHPDNGYPHSWLTRDYGTFGPRRPDPRNGKPFEVKQGESLVQRVGILVHTGDVTSGRVAERYRQYIEGKL